MVLGALGDTLTLIGAIGGLVAIVGVGVLILLLASKSREIQAMRDWIEAEPERQQAAQHATIAEVQRRIAQARERRATQAAPAKPGVSTAKPPVPPAIPAAAGVAVPAAAAGAAAAAAKPGTPAPPAPIAPATPGAPVEPPKPAFAPLTPAAAEAAEPQVVDEETALTDEPLEPADPVAPAGASFAAARGDDTRYDDADFELVDDGPLEPRGGNKVLFGVGIAVLLSGFVLLGVLLLGGGDEEPAGSSSASTEQTPGDGETPEPDPSTPEGGGEVDPSTVTVRVLNGTQISGLAQRVTDQLTGDGYRSVSPDTYSSDALNDETTVHYRDGFKDAATQIAEDLGLSSSAVKAMDAELRVAATEQADVAVLVGTDLDNGTSPTTG